MTADFGHAGPADEPTGLPTGEMPASLAETLRYGPFHRALRDAIALRGLSLARLRAHIEQLGVQVGQSTLSYWQRGLRHPEVPRAIPTVRALEIVLNLPTGSLTSLIGPRPSPRPTPSAFAELASAWADTAPLLSEFDAIPESSRSNADLEMLCVHDAILIGGQHEQRAVTTRLVVRALRAGPDRYLAVHQGDEGSRIESAVVRPGEGCRQGRLRRQAASRGLAGSITAVPPLHQSDSHAIMMGMAA